MEWEALIYSGRLKEVFMEAREKLSEVTLERDAAIKDKNAALKEITELRNYIGELKRLMPFTPPSPTITKTPPAQTIQAAPIVAPEESPKAEDALDDSAKRFRLLELD